MPAPNATWTDPTTNVDGSPITPGEITGYTVGVRDTTVPGSAVGTYPFTITAPATATSAMLSALTPALPTGRVLAAAVQANTAVNSSVWTQEVTFTIAPPAPPVPNAPTGFGVA